MTSGDISREALKIARRQVRHNVKYWCWDIFRFLLIIAMFGFNLHMFYYGTEGIEELNAIVVKFLTILGAFVSAIGIWFGLQLLFSRASLVRASRELVNWYDRQEKVKALFDNNSRDA